MRVAYRRRIESHKSGDDHSPLLVFGRLSAGTNGYSTSNASSSSSLAADATKAAATGTS